MTVPKFGLAPTVFPQPPQIDPDKISEEDPKMLAETVKELLMYIKKLAPYDNALKNNINRNFIASGKRIDNFSVNELEAATGWFKKVFVGRTSQFYFDGDKGTMVVTDTDGNKRLELGLIAANQIGLKVWDSDDNLVFDIDGAVLPTDILRDNDVLLPANLPENLGYLSGGKWPVSYIPNLSANIFTSGIIATNRLDSQDVINSELFLTSSSPKTNMSYTFTNFRPPLSTIVSYRYTVPSNTIRRITEYPFLMLVPGLPVDSPIIIQRANIPVYRFTPRAPYVNLTGLSVKTGVVTNPFTGLASQGFVKIARSSDWSYIYFFASSSYAMGGLVSYRDNGVRPGLLWGFG